MKFEVLAKVMSETDDFYVNRVIYYDFDGNGEWDLTTKKDIVTYTYPVANEDGYTPRAAVEYKGYKGISE
ncbi:hypothetical protein IJM86_02790 [bacterium]|nr:hypothetical protein [bacterium]